VSESDLLFDTWAWFEYLHQTPIGESLRRRFVLEPRYRLHTSSISLAEIGARLETMGAKERIDPACGSIRRASHIWDVTADIAQDAGPARARLREASDTASLADAIILVTAQRAGARIVSADPAFSGIPGTIRR
jgi:predicted nucleic acid-binding protein